MGGFILVDCYLTAPKISC